MPVRSKPIQRDTLRFQFFIGRKPEDTRPGLNRTGNFTVTYTLPFHDDFTVANLKSHVEKEHDQITKQATRLTNESKRTERITVANAVVEAFGVGSVLWWTKTFSTKPWFWRWQRILR